MLTRSYLSSKLSSFLFLNISGKALDNIFHMSFNEEFYMPLKADDVIDGVKANTSFDEIPVKKLVEAMYFIIGCDESFRYSSFYVQILRENQWCSSIVKGKIAEYIKKENYLDSYILLRGLYILEETSEIYNNLLWCIYNQAKKDKELQEELNNIIEHGKEKKYPNSYFYESLQFNEDGQFVNARDSLNLYYSFGRENSVEISEFNTRLGMLANFQLGRESAKENPKYALELLIPLLDEMEEDPYLYLYIAIAYRGIGIYQKAIYYLNEAVRIDNTIIDIFNELGLNYACLNDFDTAILYFRKVFEVTRSIEVCTNLVMCYIKKGDIKQANSHIDLAKKLDPEDAVLKEIENLLRGNKENNGD